MQKLDLHGLTLHSAWKKVDIFLNTCYHNKYKSCEIICGQGLIKQEIEIWLHSNAKVREYRLSRTQGSYIIKFIKRKIT